MSPSPDPARCSIRPTTGSADEIALVAERMRATLVEVLGEAQGGSMYSLDWLRDRVAFHLDPARSDGALFLAERGGAVVGHTMVRVEHDPEPYGLFSTTWVCPEHRRAGVANALLDAGEAWFAIRGLPRFATDTSDANTPLLRLFSRRGYEIVHRAPEARMVRLGRPAPDPRPADRE